MIKIINFLFGSIFLRISLSVIYFKPTRANEFESLLRKFDEVDNQNIAFTFNLTQALILIEDKRYFHHLGVDFYSIFRALFKNCTRSRIEGASTIPQQVVRIITGRRERTIKRKINEAFLALLLNYKCTKEQIINAYIRLTEFNHGRDIIEVCKIENYNLSSLTNLDCAVLASRFKYPFINKRNYILYLKRVRIIEMKMEINRSNENARTNST